MPDHETVPLDFANTQPDSKLTYPMIRELATRVWKSSGRLAYMDATDLAHECFLRLAKSAREMGPDQPGQVAYCITLIRRMVIDEVRRRTTQRLVVRPTIVLHLLADSPEPQVDFLELDAALVELASVDSQAAQIVEMSFFAGLNQASIADVLGISVRTVRRDWALARAWLLNRLEDRLIK